MHSYLQHRKKFKSGKHAAGERILTDEQLEPSMLVQQRNSLQQLQDDQRNWENETILDALHEQPRLHRYQRITALISLLDSKKSQHARETYQDRGGAHFMTTYSDDQALKLAKAGLFKDVDTPFTRDIQRQAIEQHLDTILSEKDCGRSELARDVQLPDVCCLPPDPNLSLI